MNWGHKILIVIILFLMAMVGMVIYASMQTNEMVDENYYQKEMAYQDVIDAKKNLLTVSTDNVVSQTMLEVVITLPVGTFEKLEKGTIELMRSDSEAKDMHLDIKAHGNNRYVFQKSDLSKGMYKARISWVSNGTAYYKEESVFVEK